MKTYRSAASIAVFSHRKLALRCIAVGAIAAALLGGTAACSKSGSGGSDKSASSDSKEKRYPLTGEIVGIDAEHHQLKIQHDEVKGYMPAMTMEFPASPGDIANAKVGQKIRAELVVASPSDVRVEKIWPADATSNAAIDSAANALTQDTVIRGNKAYREVGEKLPNFALYDQAGQVVKSDRFKGKQIMLNFIYTRCPIASMCPAATIRFQEVQKDAREAGINNLELISITLDPEYDSPGVLKQYASDRGIDTSNWAFLTGPEGAIKSLLAQFGVFAEFEGSILKHTLATLLISENGKILDRADGSTWDAKEFVSKMKR